MFLNDNYLVRATAFDGRVRALAVDSTSAVRELAQLQGTGPAATAALGRVATGTLLLGATLKKETHLVTVQVKGDGPGGTVLASANGRGEVRGLVGNPRPAIQETIDGKLNVSGVVGTRGRITVIKDLGLKEPYNSTVELVSGEIGKDFAYYFARSEQQPSAVGLGVFVDRFGEVVAAGGYIIQILGGLDADAVETLEREIAGLPHPTTMIRAGESPEDVLERVFGKTFNVLDRSPVRFHCPCSRDRAERALILLGPGEIDAIIATQSHQGHSDVTCEFCGTNYRFTLDQLTALTN
ncbi:MAG: Hsp33 family molecular chaperone HslO [Gemmatimonadetes bacterium]|nr:Hsp33 family molecular chaperone HslO [Gemmatimonadota bacterium]NIQ53006.1 Hsp33 family molecular chaperone HslO [Gemmatimonadota bacterium]NIU73150.1 Hsp33 family molecular chaperone HslO [Gammaproteobacteria bacterium]NIX43444.1 Hsp33 family molecular chaperone HslO [Gemmatimonadota bacterium]NIY07620.1 Hsp33 family molecular chaperone HslO [Gemmatimonadota bacterium]